MEPLTHLLTGVCISRAGFNRKTTYATVAAMIAADAADLDLVWGLGGPVELLKHHRGITHTLIAAPVVAGVVTGGIWLYHRWRNAPYSHPAVLTHRAKAPTAPPAMLWLYLTSLIAALSHILLDWTNSYGIRPFFPFNPRWYAANTVYIAEPVIWALLFLALFMPWVLGLADREIGARRDSYPGRGWAIFALAAMVALWCWRGLEQAKGEAMLSHAQVTSEPVLRVVLLPYAGNPYRWHAIMETKDFYQTAELDTWNPDSPAAIDSDPLRDVIYKPADTPAVEAAKQTLLGRVYQDWGTWRVIRDVGQVPIRGIDPPQLPPNRHWTTVEFSDLRYGYSFMASRLDGRTPLGGAVYIVDDHDEDGESLDGEEQK